jgi:hypothetical protein
MKSLNKSIYEYGKQVEKGDIRKAYRGLMDFIKGLRIYFKDHYPEYGVSGNIYQGYMDITFFSFAPKALKDRDLKLAIVFVHEKIEFEVWLTGRNTEIQTKYRELLRKKTLSKYSVSTDEKGVSSIIEHTLVENPDFDNPQDLTKQIEFGVEDFIKDIEKLLN